MVKKRFTILILLVNQQSETFACGIACHRYSTFDFYELINVFSFV